MSCRGNARHWFAYYGMVGSSAPKCQHEGCDAPNPNYTRDCDPFAYEGTQPELLADMTDEVERSR